MIARRRRPELDGPKTRRDDARVHLLFPDDPERRRKRDRILLVLAIVLAVVLVLRAARKGDSVLVRNQEWGARVAQGVDPYVDTIRGGRLHGPYPPSYAIVCAPLSMLPTKLARVAWATAQIAALAGMFVLVRRWLTRGWPSVAPHASVVYAIGVLVASRYILRDMAGGGGNMLYAASMLWGIEIALQGRVFVPALLVALPLAVKPNLAPLACVVLLRGGWRTFALALLLLAALAWSPALWFGAEGWSALWSRWIHDVIAYSNTLDLSSESQVPAGFPVDDTGMNQSLRAAFGRAAASFGEPAPFEAAAWIARAIGAIGVAATAIVCARARSARSRILAMLAFLPASLLASPITWKAHHAVLVGLFALMAATAVERGKFGRRAWFLTGYWIVCGLLSGEVVGVANKQWLQSVSVVTAFTVAVLAIVLVEAVRSDAIAPDDSCVH